MGSTCLPCYRLGARMPKSATIAMAYAEWVLARFVGEARAGAIMGDLTEMAASRGRFWFWAAYARTLISVGWRTPVAFLCAYIFSLWIGNRLFSITYFLFRPFQRPLRTFVHTAAFATWGSLLGDALVALWFILPFVLVRLGLRDRLAQLTFAFFLFTAPFFCLLPVGMYFAGVAAVVMIVTALSLRTWRRPMIVLAGSVAPIAVANRLSPKLWYVFLSRGYTFDSPQLQRVVFLYHALELSIAALVGSYLYRRLLQPRPADLPPSGAVHA